MIALPEFDFGCCLDGLNYRNGARDFNTKILPQGLQGFNDFRNVDVGRTDS
jgi:hypothetical protein